MLQEAKASGRKAPGIYNRLDRDIPDLKRCWRGAGSFTSGKGETS